jgi:putative phosphonate metabolism protein
MIARDGRMSMTGSPRYAIYYAPAAGSALDRFGARLLGYDAWTGADITFADGIVEMVSDWRELTTDARKYGFHATLKAPFRLAGDSSDDSLRAACAAFAAAPRPLPRIRPVVEPIGGFIAVIPGDPSSELQQFAADCVRTFEPFRAPMTAEDRARRKPEHMTPRQVEHLDRWGYPYVMEEFRFHMTLTCRLGADRRASILAMLRERFAALDMQQLTIDRIALFRQDDAASRFRIAESWGLAN